MPRDRPPATTSPTLVTYATRSGGTTLDNGVGGGNPFATALIEVAQERDLTVGKLPRRLRDATVEKSGGHQTPECRRSAALGAAGRAHPFELGRRRCALVLVVSDYSRLSDDSSLPGAARDERRVAAMLAQQGFSVTQGVGGTRRELLGALASFRRVSSASDVAVVYSTGHGFESDGVVSLLPGDYPIDDGLTRSRLGSHAVSVDRMARAANASILNLVFFAGCRSLV